MKRLPVPLAVLALLAAPASATEPDWHLEATTASVQAGAASSIAADLRIMVLDHGVSLGPLASAPFHVQADDLHLEMDYAEPSINAGPAASAAPVHGTTPTDHGHATAAGTENRASYRLIVAPLESGSARLEAESDCARIESASGDTIRQDPFVVPQESRAPIEAPVGDATAMQDCGPATNVTVRGDFVLGLWDWDFRVADASGTTEYQTGRLASTAGDEASAAVSRDQEAYLFVHNGVLRLGLGGAGHALYVADAALESQTGMTLHDATGRLEAETGRVEFQGEDVHVQGQARLEVRQATPEGFQTRLGGEAEEVRIGASAIPLTASVVPSIASEPSWPMFLAGLLVATVAFVLVVPAWQHQGLQSRGARVSRGDSWRQRQCLGLSAWSQGLSRRHLAILGLPIATLALAFAQHPQARIAKARAYTGLRLHGRALRVHERLDARLAVPRERTRNAWTAYHVAREAARPREAATWLHRAHACDPAEFLRVARAWPKDGSAPVPVDVAFN